MAGTTATTATPPRWSRIDLLDAARRRVMLDVIHPGGRGRIVEVREKDVVVEMAFPGRAYVQLDAIITPPPVRFAPGARVQTPYGKGVVRQLRASEERVDYVVDLIENTLNGAPAVPALARVDSFNSTDGVDTPTKPPAPPALAADGRSRNCAVAYLNASDVTPRIKLTAEECVAEADGERARGNEAFKAKDYDAAMVFYQSAANVLSGYDGVPLTATQKKAYLDSFLKTMGNTAQCQLRRPTPDYEAVIHYATEAINLDPLDLTGNQPKNLLRRGEAYYHQGKYAEAINDLKHESLTRLTEAQKLLKAARDAKAKEASHNKKVWSNAFAKAAEDSGSAVANSPTSVVDVGAGRVRFASPTPHAPAPAATPTGGSVGELESPDKGEGATNRTLFAGATPYPGLKKRSALAEVGGDVTKVGHGGVSADGTMLAEAEAEAEEEGSTGGGVLPWLVGGAAVLLGAGALWYLSSRGSRPTRR